MYKIIKIIKSRTNITIGILFLLGGFQNITDYMSPEVSTLILGVLSALAVYFRTNPMVEFKE
jgi:hypothetical protein